MNHSMWACVVLLIALVYCSHLGISQAPDGKITDENVAREWLNDYDKRAMDVYYKAALASWNYNTNLTDHNQRLSTEARVARSAFINKAAKNTSMFNWRNFQDEDIKRQFSKLAIANVANLPTEKVTKVNILRSSMKKIYSTGEVCGRPSDFDKSKCYSLEPGLVRLMATSRDYEDLRWAWKGWRDSTGKKMKSMYTQYAGLQNEGSRLDRFTDQGAYWRSWYEMDGFEAEIERLWNQVKPMYQQLHTYIRRKLMEKYKGKDFPETHQIPAHLLGNMWAQTWANIDDIVHPFKDKAAIDVTAKLVERNYTATHMFKISEEFFTSLGLLPMPQEFWNESMIEKPNDQEVVCHASAWDFSNRKDYRIKQCTDITMEYLITTHHEMGHIQYALQYKDQPLVYRDGSNPGFHEAVGDVMALSVATPEHLHKIGLLNEVENDTESDLNFLMSQALAKVAFLPFGYLMDQWRWSVFRGNTTEEKYTQEWWRLRCKHQGIAPPVSRTSSDFDPGAKYHIPANTPYIRYFVSYILQFQIHKALCETAGNTAPLHRCDIYQSKAAGTKLGNMLTLGTSKKWPDALEQVTGSRTMDAKPMLDYFKPLVDWLKEQNKGSDVTWDENCPDGSVAGLNSSSTFVLPSAVTVLAGVAISLISKVL